MKVAGEKVRWETETTELQRPGRAALRSVDAPYELSYTLIDHGASTEVRYDGSTGTLGGFFGELADPLVALMYQRDMNGILANLKSNIEESSTSTPGWVLADLALQYGREGGCDAL